MNILRRIAVGLLVVVFFLSSISLAWGHVLSRGMTAEQVKARLQETNFYGKIADVIFEGVANAEDQEAGLIPADEAVFKQKISEVFDPGFLQTNAETAIDSMFSWLDGKTDKPEFRIDLTEKRVQLAAALGDYAVSRGQSLPICTEIPADVDPLSADCLPPGFDTQQLKGMVENELLNQSDFVSEPVITADTFTNQEQQSNFFDDAEQYRTGYQRLKNAYIFAGVLTLLSAIGIVMLSGSRSKGFLRLGVVSTFTTVMLGLGYFVLTQGPAAVREALAKEGSSVNGAAAELAADIFDNFASTNQKMLGLYAIGFGLLAVASFVAYVTLKRHNNLEEPEDKPKDPKPPIDDSPKVDPAKAPAAEAKPVQRPKPPRKIQL